MREVSVATIPVNTIRPNEYNPNKMPKGTFQKLKLSVQQFGLFNPILVRENNGYEIVDGEWRWRAYCDLKLTEIQCKIIEATDEEVKQIIFATTIKGKHNAYDSQQVLKDFVGTSDSNMLKACNLDKTKVERKTKYLDFQKGTPIQKGGQRLMDESFGLPEMGDYKVVLTIPLSKTEYDFVIKKLGEMHKDVTQALLTLLK